MAQANYYQERINKALDYINKNLGEEIRIKELAQTSHFSPFHFQRIYKSLQNETPYETLKRLRLEKSVFLLKHNPTIKISDVASDCGFPSIENFSRQFKERYGHSPSVFKNDTALHNSRIYQEQQPVDFYHCYEESRKSLPQKFEVTVEALDEIPILFVRAIFGADGSGLLEKYNYIIDWVTERGIPYKGLLNRFGMSIDNPEVTPANKYRYDFAIRNPDYIKGDGIIENGQIPGGLYATLHCKGKITDVSQAWDYFFKVWLPTSDYKPIHYPALEEFVQGPEEIGWDTFNQKCRVPVEKINYD